MKLEEAYSYGEISPCRAYIHVHRKAPSFVRQSYRIDVCCLNSVIIIDLVGISRVFEIIGEAGFSLKLDLFDSE